MLIEMSSRGRRGRAFAVVACPRNTSARLRPLADHLECFKWRLRRYYSVRSSDNGRALVHATTQLTQRPIRDSVKNVIYGAHIFLGASCMCSRAFISYEISRRGRCDRDASKGLRYNLLPGSLSTARCALYSAFGLRIIADNVPRFGAGLNKTLNLPKIFKRLSNLGDVSWSKAIFGRAGGGRRRGSRSALIFYTSLERITWGCSRDLRRYRVWGSPAESKGYNLILDRSTHPWSGIKLAIFRFESEAQASRPLPPSMLLRCNLRLTRHGYEYPVEKSA
ncbi:hypothetical protein EVAR_31175_1 [Eumeta japonica]|uniref:Uncharacterized protein n=1 Tax=Eumeta variegata TaxID=151549 RepID=A0A4C1VWT7_EUMVA|nr:hypothetical protein EVAR_31175_1 [Eumeta japonica]